MNIKLIPPPLAVINIDTIYHFLAISVLFQVSDILSCNLLETLHNISVPYPTVISVHC